MSESIVSTLTAAFSGEEGAFEWKLLHRFCQLLAQSGAPVSLDTLAQALACKRSRVVQALERYPEAEYGASGNLVGLGLTLRPTVHQLVLEKRSFFTWCAPDALLIPVMLDQPAQILSTCPVTGTRIEVRLSPERLESLSPASAVVSFAKDGSLLKKLKETGCIRQGGCENQFFFASGEVVASWVAEHANFRVLPVEDAFLDFRAFAQQQKALASRA
jgi:alkylmercury lyase